MARERQQVLVAGLLRAWKSFQRLLARPVLENGLDRQAERVVDSAVVLRDRDHGAARLFEQLRADAAYVAEALHDDAGLVRRAAQAVERRHPPDRHPPPLRLPPTRPPPPPTPLPLPPP